MQRKHRRHALPTAIVGVVVAVAALGCTSSTNGASDTQTTTKLSDNSFKSTCDGAGVARAKAYDKNASQHKVVYFSPYRDGLISSTTDLPVDWRVTYDPNSDAFAQVDLVLCAVRTADTYVKQCDGYKDSKTGRSDDVANVHRATYQVSVHEAATGRELGSTKIDANDDSCPMFVSFEDNASTVEYYVPPPAEQVLAVAKPFAQT